MLLSYCSVPENGLLLGIWRGAVLLGPCVLLPTRQDRHAVLFAKSFLGFLPCLDFFAQATFFLNHFQHCMVSVQPLHTCHLLKKAQEFNCRQSGSAGSQKAFSKYLRQSLEEKKRKKTRNYAIGHL